MQDKMKRKYWIDMIRGFAIILIVIGHFFQNYSFTNYIYIFHVPLFFVISGLCYNSYGGKLKDYIFKKTKAIVIPYICFGVIIVPMTFLVGSHTTFNFAKVVIKYIVQRRFTTMWFLTTLFVVEVMFNYLERHTDSKIRTIIVSLLISGGAIIYERVINVPIPWNIDLALLCLGFYAIGYSLKSSKIYNCEMDKTFCLIVGAGLFTFGIVLGIVSINISAVRLDIFYGQLGMPCVGIMGSICSCLGLVLVFSILPQIRILEYVGQHTMTIFALHQMLFKQIFFRFLGFPDAIGVAAFSVVITICICLYLDVFIGRGKFSFILGRRQK